MEVLPPSIMGVPSKPLFLAMLFSEKSQLSMGSSQDSIEARVAKAQQSPKAPWFRTAGSLPMVRRS